MEHYCFFIVLAALASGCASHREKVLVGPVGPPPLVAPGRSDQGALVVYSALDFGMPGDAERVSYHSGYQIYSAAGRRFKYVNNRVGTYIEDPVTVGLLPGLYKVRARAAAFGFVTTSVVIEAGMTTFIHLDGSELSSGTQTPASRLVRLPDGLIIGWQAKESGETK
jgi:hypothetical protein